LISFYPRTLQSALSAYGSVDYAPFFTSTDRHCQKYQLPNVVINVEQKATVKQCLPFPLNRPYLDLANANIGLWSLNSTTVNPVRLNSQLTPAIMDFEVYMAFKDVELYAPVQVQSGEVSSSVIDAGMDYVKMLLRTAKPMFQYTSVWQMIGRSARSVAEAMGFSRPLLVPSIVHVDKDRGSMCYVSGAPDFSEKLSLDPRVSMDVSGARIPLCKEGDTNIKEITSKWGLVARDIVVDRSYEVRPTISLASGTTFHTTPLAFASLPFNFWRGIIDFKFEFVSNALLRTRYAIVVVPPGSTSPASYVPGITYETFLVDVVGRTEAIISVPYYNSDTFTSMSPLSTSSLLSNFTRLVVFCIDVVQGQTGTPTNLPYNVFVRAGKDFELAVPLGSVLKQYVVTQSGESSSAGSGESSVATFGEKVTDLLQLSRRFSFDARFNTNNISAYGIVALPCDGFFNSTTTSIGGPVPIIVYLHLNPFYKYLASAYLGRTGGYRFKFYKRLDCSVRAWILQAGGYGLGPVGQQPYLVAPIALSTKDNAVLELEIPSQCSELFTAGYNAATGVPAGSSGYTLSIENLLTVDTAMELDMYSAGADDFKVGGFLCAPLLK